MILPYFLNNALGIDDEVEDFTQDGGWQKLDNLLPLLHRSGGWLGGLESWIDYLDQFAYTLNVSLFPFLGGCL